MADYTIEEIMHREPLYARLGEPLTDVVETLTQSHVMGIPVIDDGHRVVGFISEQDCIHSLLATSYFCEGNPAVDEFMSREPLTLSPQDSVVDLARTMGRDKPKVYPVVSEGKLVGLVTRNDVLVALLQEARQCSRHGSSA